MQLFLFSFSSIFIMVSFITLATTALAFIPIAITAPNGIESRISHETVGKQLESRQGGTYSFWSEGSGDFRCNNQGGGKYSCNWSGQAGGGFIAGTGFKPGGSRYVVASLTKTST